MRSYLATILTKYAYTCVRKYVYANTYKLKPHQNMFSLGEKTSIK